MHDPLYRLNCHSRHLDENSNPQMVRKRAYVLYTGTDDRRVASSYKECVALYSHFFNLLSRYFPHHDVILKPHPGEEFYGNIDLYKDAAGENRSKIKIADPHALLPQLICQSDLVISFSPSVLLESILLKKQVIYMSTQSTPMSVTCQQQGAHILKTPLAAFPRSLDEALPHFKISLGRPLELSADFIEKVAYRWDGRAADRIALAVEQLLSKKRLNTVDGILQDTDGDSEVLPPESFDRGGPEEVGPQADEPGASEPGNKKARKCLEERDFDKALDVLKRIIEGQPDSAVAHNELGVAYDGQGNKSKALHHYEQAARLDPQNLNFQKKLADFYVVESGRIEDALVIYNQVLKSDPRDIETLMALAHICIAVEKPASARDFYTKILDIEPWNDEARIALEKMEKPESGLDAEEFCNHLPAVEPWNAEARENLDKPTQPHNLATSGASAEVEYKKIQRQMQSGDGKSVYQLENFLLAHPQFASAHNDLGVLYYNRGDREKALYHYELAARIEPKNSNFQKNLAYFYFVESGRAEDALAVYNQILERDAGDVEALMSIGLICEALERREDAVHFYNRVLENEPWNVNARERLEKLYPN
jgi:cytochrome c-type biogenesis protein CcmH/NrfG